MLVFRNTEGVFSVRAVAVLRNGDRVLLHRAEHDAFWVLPGGRVEFNEDGASAIVREMREELEIEVRVERPLWVVENFFVYNGDRCHGMELYFLVTPDGESDLSTRGEEWIGYEGACRLIFRWFTLEELAAVELHPAFLREALRALPDGMELRIQRDKPVQV